MAPVCHAGQQRGHERSKHLLRSRLTQPLRDGIPKVEHHRIDPMDLHIRKQDQRTGQDIDPHRIPGRLQIVDLRTESPLSAIPLQEQPLPLRVGTGFGNSDGPGPLGSIAELYFPLGQLHERDTLRPDLVRPHADPADQQQDPQQGGSGM